MSYRATVFKVMIASPSDVLAERAAIRNALVEWNVIHADSRKIVLLPVGWETHSTPTMGDKPQNIINEQILGDCDLLVGVFWTRIGTATDAYASGTVEEIEEHVVAGKPAMLYFSNAPVLPDSVDHEQYSNLKAFRDSCKSRGLYETYANIEEFREKFFRQVQLKLNKDKFFKVEEGDVAEAPLTDWNQPTLILTREAQVLLKEAAKSNDGCVYLLRSMDGTLVQANGQNFVEDKNPRSAAKWEGAVEELESNDLISGSSSGAVFRVTRAGFDLVDSLSP